MFMSNMYVCSAFSHFYTIRRKYQYFTLMQIAEDYSHCEFLIRLPGYCPSMSIFTQLHYLNADLTKLMIN